MPAQTRQVPPFPPLRIEIVAAIVFASLARQAAEEGDFNLALAFALLARTLLKRGLEPSPR